MANDKQIAIVTGAASGIGRAMTLGLLGAGVDVAAVDRNETSLAALAATVQDKAGHDADHPRGSGPPRTHLISLCPPC